MDKHSIKSKANYKEVLKENPINPKTQTNEDEEM
jgi:hypothetical protein